MSILHTRALPKKGHRWAFLVLSLWLLIVPTGCISENLNRSPNGVTDPDDVPISSLIVSVQVRLAFTLGGLISRYTGMVTQHFDGETRQHAILQDNAYGENDFNALWSHLYSGVLEDTKLLKEKALPATADQDTLEDVHAIALILEAYTYSVITNMWGSAPFSEALKDPLDPANRQPKYDTRDEIFAGIHQKLAAAIAGLEKQGEEPSFSYADLYYERDLVKWLKAAHSLQARFYLHRGELEKAKTHLAQGFTDRGDDMQFQFGDEAGELGPMAQFMAQRGDISFESTALTRMQREDDPRVDDYLFKPDRVEDYIDSYLSKADHYVVLMSYSELQFIAAELAVREGQTNQARDAMMRGTIASIEQVTGQDPERQFPDFLFELRKKDVNLPNIIEQKYIALAAQMEPYNDLRRLANPIGLNPTQGNVLSVPFPLRFPYPQTESLFNRTNLDAARTGEDGEPLSVQDLMAQPLEWDKDKANYPGLK